MPEWDEGWDTESGDPPESLFAYVEPWVANTTVLAFPETPGPEPETPQRAAFYDPPRAPKPGFVARLFGKKAPPEMPPRSPEQFAEDYTKMQKAIAAHALWTVSVLAARCRALGLRRVFGIYDGGGDESFTDFRGIEMNDGRVITAAELGIPDTALRRDTMLQDGLFSHARAEVQRSDALAASALVSVEDAGQLVESAAAALMGAFDAGEFALHGVLIIDVGACTITDEKNFDVVFGDKKPWEI
jgi:hypothetical protein